MGTDDTFGVFFDGIAWLLAFFYSLVPSYGFAIIALTLCVMIILTPLTLKGTRSMMMMQQLQPEMKKLQSKFKDDRQQLNEELMKFYKENNINPLGGCLPLLVQMPVFIVLYNVLRGLTLRVPLTNAGWVVGQQGTAAPVTKPPLVQFDPAYLDKGSSMYVDLSQTSTMAFLGLDLAESCSEALQRGVVHSIPYVLLIIVVGVSGFVQQRQIQGRTPDAQVNPQQQTIMKIMPIFLPVISFGLPSGLVLYFAVSNLYRIGQQWFISRSIYGIKRGDAPAGGATAAKGSGGAKGGTDKGDKGDKVGATKGGARTKAATPSSGNGRSGGSGSDRGDAKRGKSTNQPSKASASKGSSSKGSSSKDASGKDASSTRTAARAARAGGTKSSGSKDTGSTKAKGTPAKQPTSSSGETAPSQATPTLQPRARKNKKR